MNWAIPCAPAGETAFGLKFDSAISWAASSAAETFQRVPPRAAAASRKRAGTKAGQPGRRPPPRRRLGAATRSPAAEHGAGPASKPKCHGSQE